MSWIITQDTIEGFQQQAMNSMPGIKSLPLNIGANNSGMIINGNKMTASLSFTPIPVEGALGLHFDNDLIDFTENNNTINSNSGTFSTDAKFGSYSINYNGSQYTDYLDSNIFTFGSDDFYFDFWIKRNGGLGVQQWIFGQTNSTALTPNTSVYCVIQAGNTVNFGVGIGGVLYNVVTTATITDTTTWHNIRCGRNGNNIYVAVDGTVEGPTAISGSLQDSTNNFAIGRHGEYPTNPFNGKVDEFLFVKGIGMNTTNFTSNTESYGNTGASISKSFDRLNLDKISFPKIYLPVNTVGQIDVYGDTLLENPRLPSEAIFGLHFDNDTVDFLGAKTPTVNSGTFDASNKKFGTHAIKYLSASSQYTSWADSADWATGVDSFYYDFWMRRTTTGVAQNVCGQGNTGAFTTISHYLAFLSTNDVLTFGACVSSTNYTIASTTTISDTEWHHIRAGRDGNTIRLFIDGIQQGSGTAITGTVNDVAEPLSIGRIGSTASTYFDGNIDEFLFVNGKSPGNSNFTPPINQYQFVTAVSSTTVTLGADASAVDDFYNGNILRIVSGAGAGQFRIINDYDGTTKIATVDTFSVNPTTSSGMLIYDVVTENLLPGFDFNNIDYNIYPVVNVVARIEVTASGATPPTLGLPIISEISHNKIQRGKGTTTLSGAQATVDVTLDEPINIYGAKARVLARSTSATGYIIDATAELISETGLQLKFSGSNATAPLEYIWEVESI